MSDTKEDKALSWKRIEDKMSTSSVVDEQVVDLLAGLGKKSLGEAACKVKQAVDMVGAYVTDVQAEIVRAEEAHAKKDSVADLATASKDSISAAVEGLRHSMAEVEVPSWDKCFDGKPPPSASDDPDGSEWKALPGGPADKRFEGHLEKAHAHVSMVSKAIEKADLAANFALAVVALAKRKAMAVVDEAPTTMAKRAKRGCYRTSVSCFVFHLSRDKRWCVANFGTHAFFCNFYSILASCALFTS